MKIKSKGLPAATLTLLIGSPLAAEQPKQDLPFKLRQGHRIVVKGTIGGSHEVNMLIDTGASGTVVSKRIAGKLKLKMLPQKVTYNGAGLIGRVPMAVVRNLSMGPIKTSRSCLVADIPAHNIDVIIGMNVLRRQNLTIDFVARKIVFGQTKQLESTVAFDPDAALIVVPFRVQDREIRLMLDSGAEELCLFGSRVKSWIRGLSKGSPIEMVHMSGTRRGSEVWLRDVQLGQTEWKVMKAIVLDGDMPKLARDIISTSPWDGVLGLVSLKFKRIHIDFQQGVLSWEK